MDIELINAPVIATSGSKVEFGPRVYCDVCKKEVSPQDIAMFPVLDLSTEFVVRCHGKYLTFKQTMVASLVDSDRMQIVGTVR